MSLTVNHRGSITLAPLHPPARGGLSTGADVVLTQATSYPRDIELVLSAIISSLQGSRNALATEILNALAVVTPLRCVPDELTTALVDMAESSRGDALEVGPQAAPLRSVHASWTDVVDGAPRAWFAAFAVSPTWYSSHLSLSVRLVRALPMTVAPTASSVDDMVMPALSYLTAFQRRWRTAVLRASWSCFSSNIFLSHHCEMLTAAELHLEGDAASGALRWLRSANALRSLVLAADQSRMSRSFTLEVPPLPQLSSLTLRGLRDGHVPFIVSLLRSLSQVEYLRVDSLLLDGDNVENETLVHMPRLRDLWLDNHVGFVLAIICAPRLQRLTLSDFDDFRPGIRDLATMLNRAGAQPRIEALTMARVDSCLPRTSDDLTQCLQSLRWLKVLDIDDCSTWVQPLGTPLLFDTMTFRVGAPVVLPALSVFRYRMPPNGMSPGTQEAARRFRASRLGNRYADDRVVACAVKFTISDI
ncbi:hypothetical protein EV121DRAFT_297063 [Schizophyllum commune]